MYPWDIRSYFFHLQQQQQIIQKYYKNNNKKNDENLFSLLMKPLLYSVKDSVSSLQERTEMILAPFPSPSLLTTTWLLFHFPLHFAVILVWREKDFCEICCHNFSFIELVNYSVILSVCQLVSQLLSRNDFFLSWFRFLNSIQFENLFNSIHFDCFKVSLKCILNIVILFSLAFPIGFVSIHYEIMSQWKWML